MFCTSLHSRTLTRKLNRTLNGTLKTIALTTLVAGLTAAQALTSAGPQRPASVPSSYVITPFGYFDPSCVGHLAKGDVVRHDKKAIEHANGSFEDMHVCGFAHYKADGTKIMGDEQAQPNTDPSIGHAWVEYAGVTTTSAYGEIYAQWTVPPAPETNDGQTVYLFNGLEDYQDVVTIIQPVLGWNSDYASAWGIASWNCCESGTVYEATPTRVNSGDQIVGLTFNNCASGTKTCTSWDILTFDLTSGNYSELVDTSNFGQTFNWAFGGVLEVYNIAQCGDYPGGGGSFDFFEQYLYNDKLAQIKPAWKITNLSSGLSPQCSYGGSTPEEVILTY
jgi:hypothetical protein